jgi:phage gpG-like protein
VANGKTQVKSNLDGLNQLTKMLKDDKFLRIGIIGSKATNQHDSESGLSNALLGTYHEFGGESKNGKEQPPQRSFLSMPLKEHLKFDEPQMKELKKVMWKQFFVKKSPDKFWQTLMTKALEVVEEAFDTEGWGQWKSLTDETRKLVDKRRKQKEDTAKWRNYWYGKIKWTDLGDGIETYEHLQGRQILTDTGKLRRSISGKIMKRK